MSNGASIARDYETLKEGIKAEYVGGGWIRIYVRQADGKYAEDRRERTTAVARRVRAINRRNRANEATTASNIG